MPIDNPQDIYNGSGPGLNKNGQVPVPTQEAYDELKSKGQNMSRAGGSYKGPEGADKLFSSGESDVQKYFGNTGAYDPLLTGQDLNLEMGERQSWGNKLARRAANLLPNIASDIVDMAGNVGALLTEWGDERDYSNALNQAAAAIKDPFGGTYKRSNDTWAISDPTWWFDNAAMIGEYAGAFSVGGAGIGRVLNTASEGIIDGLNLSQKASKLVKSAALLGTNATVSYAEGAQAGAQVYQETYDNQYIKGLAAGLDPDSAKAQAKHIAAQSAATTAQLSTLLTMGLNAGAYAPYFREADDLANNIISKRIAQTENMANGERAASIRGMNASDYFDILHHHAGIKGALGESFKEGAEEFLQQFAQDTGTDLGKDGKQDGFIDQFGELTHIIDRTANAEGLLNFVLGAGTGAVQHSLIHNVIPFKRIERMQADGTPIQKMDSQGEPMTDKKGNPVMEKTWVTPRKYERDFTTRSFNNIQDSLAADYQHQSDLETEFLGHMAKGNKIDADAVRDRMFDVGKLWAVKNGQVDPWVKTFQNIAGMDNAAAQKAGYSTGDTDNTYKDKASESIDHLYQLRDMYHDLQSAYGTKYEGNQGLKPLVDAVFARKADLFSYKNRIDSYERKIKSSEEEESRLAEVKDPDGYSKAANQYILQRRSGIAVTQQLQADHDALVKALDSNDRKTMDRLFGKYRAVATGDGDYNVPAKDLSEKLQRKAKESVDKVKQSEDTLFNSTEYNQWVKDNPGKSFDDYLREAEQRNSLNLENRNQRAQLESHRAAYEIAQKNLRDMTDEKSETRFASKVKTWQDQLAKDQEQTEHQGTMRLAELAKDKASASRLQKIELNRIADGYRVKLDETHAKIQQNAESLDRNRADLDKTKLLRDPLRVMALKKIIKGLEKEQVVLRFQATKLGTLYNNYKVPDDITQEPVPVEEVTGEVNGKDTTNASDSPTTATGVGDTHTSTDDEIMDQIINSSAKPTELVTVPTIDDEMEAMRADIEGSMQEAKEPDPVERFVEMLRPLSAPVHESVMRIINNAMQAGGEPLTLSSFAPLVQAGQITQAAATQLADAAQKYITDLNTALAEADLQSTDPVETSAYQQPEVQVTGIDIPGTPVIENTDPDSSLIVPTPLAFHAGLKIVDAAYTGATLTQAYNEGTRKDAKGNTVYFKTTKVDGVDPTKEQVLDRNGLLPGTALKFVVDLEYDGPANINDALSWDADKEVESTSEKGSDFVGKDGKVKSTPKHVGNVPIKVTDETGKTLFYIRKLDWVNARFPGATNYRNVVEKVGDVDNLALQNEQLMQLRDHIVRNYNAGTEVNGKMGAKGTGHVIMNWVTEKVDGTQMKGKIVPSFALNRKTPEASLLPDTSLQIVIHEGGGVLNSAYQYRTEKPLGFDPIQLPKGAVGALLPSPNGQHLYAPLMGQKIYEDGRPSPGLNSMVRAIELYLLNDGTNPAIKAELNILEQNTGFNIQTAAGLKNFINQYYTYSQRFLDSALSPNAIGTDGRERFLFSIDDSLQAVADKTMHIKAGFSMRGDGAKYANLVGGSLDPVFVQALQQGLATRSRAVVYTNPGANLKGINAPGSFTDASYVPGKGWQHNEYKSYNDYVKSFSRTTVYGRNQLNGKYIYSANPSLGFTVPAVGREGVLVEEQTSPTQVKPVDTPPYQADVNLFDSIFGEGPKSLLKTVTAFGTGSENSQPLTTENLEKIYNFTPVEQRNGKTVQEVLEDLKTRGHSYLSDGFNPFSLCL